MNKTELKSRLKKLFQEQRLAVLSTHDQGQPYSSLVAFVASKDLVRLLFATNRATRKYANLQQDARVCLMVDNRSNSAADFKEAMSINKSENRHQASKPMVWVKDNSGNTYICPKGSVKDPKHVKSSELKQCMNESENPQNN
ncbi:MAG: pyridoxamine 5'-phosphate oxidase family protein [Planctomycetota bacterium]